MATVFKIINPAPGLLHIEMPAFVPVESIKVPTKTFSVLCSISVGVCDQEFGSMSGNFSTQMKFENNDKRQEKQIIPISLPTPNSSLVVVGIFLKYMLMKEGNLKTYKNKDWMPAGIVDAILI